MATATPVVVLMIALALLVVLAQSDVVEPRGRRDLQQTTPPVVPFTIGALQYTRFFDTTDQHYGDCGSGPVDSKYVAQDQLCADSSGVSCTVGWTVAGEWLDYDFVVAQDTTVDIAIRVSSKNPTKQFAIQVDGDGSMTRTFQAPGQGWEIFQDLTWDNVPLTAGDHSLKISFLNGNINVCSVRVHESSSGPTTVPPFPTPSLAPTSLPHSSPTGGFRIKMHWMDTYFWQEQNFDPRWCLQCDTTPVCQDGDYARVRACDDASTNNNTIFEFVSIADGEAQIKDVQGNTCLSAENYTVDKINTRMRPCNTEDIKQIWWTGGQGDFFSSEGNPFEIHPEGSDWYCLTTHHHPKDGEDGRVEKCRWARKDDSSYWLRYYPS
jgi:hypothetical protein